VRRVRIVGVLCALIIRADFCRRFRCGRTHRRPVVARGREQRRSAADHCCRRYCHRAIRKNYWIADREYLTQGAQSCTGPCGSAAQGPQATICLGDLGHRRALHQGGESVFGLANSRARVGGVEVLGMTVDLVRRIECLVNLRGPRPMAPTTLIGVGHAGASSETDPGPG
jgi:hypothetical protein